MEIGASLTLADLPVEVRNVGPGLTAGIDPAGDGDRVIACDERGGSPCSKTASSSVASNRGIARRGGPSSGNPPDIEWDVEAAEKGGYPHFMLKEIFEQPALPSPDPRQAARFRRAEAPVPGGAGLRP